MIPMLKGSLSAQHGVSSSFGLRFDLHMSWIAANILNKQQGGADKGWSSILGFGRAANKSSP